MTIDEYMAELNRKNEAPKVPQKPAETGDFWTDMRNRWEHLNAQEQYNQQIADSAQNPHSGEMLLGEFRPANAREKYLNTLLREYKNNKNQALKEAISEHPDDYFTPNMMSANESKGGWIDKSDIIGSVGNERGTKILDAIKNEQVKDVGSLGYDTNAKYISDMATNPGTWGKINDMISGKKPEYIYHATDSKNIRGISKKGLQSASERNEKGNFPIPTQWDKVFFSESEKQGERMLPGVNRSKLRTKFRDDLLPDIHQPYADNYWQTKNTVPPQALEIETAPGQWESLLDYIRKGGK